MARLPRMLAERDLDGYVVGVSEALPPEPIWDQLCPGLTFRSPVGGRAGSADVEGRDTEIHERHEILVADRPGARCLDPDQVGGDGLVRAGRQEERRVRPAVHGQERRVRQQAVGDQRPL